MYCQQKLCAGENVKMLKSDNQTPFRYLLPGLHLAACVVAGLGNLRWWGPMFVIDFPASLLVAPLEVNVPGLLGNPMLLYGNVGTVWWFFLGRSLDRFLARRNRS